MTDSGSAADAASGADPTSGAGAPPIVDTHTHVVSPDQARYPFQPRSLSGQWYLDSPASADDLAREMDASGVERAVLVQGVGAYSFDNRYAADAALAAPERFVSACCIDVTAPDAVDQLDHWARERSMSGIRLFALSREGASWLPDESTFPVWERARELNIHVIVTILPHQLGELARVLEVFPAMPVSLDHCGFATENATLRRSLLDLAHHENLHLKVSTHNLEESIAETGEARTIVSELADAFGANRLMWGSDFCQIQGHTYAELVALARHAFGGLPPEQSAECLGGTARRLWPGLRSPLASIA